MTDSPRKYLVMADNPTVGQRCAACDVLFAVGDSVTLVPLDRPPPGARTVECRPVHWRCWRMALIYAGHPDPGE